MGTMGQENGGREMQVRQWKEAGTIQENTRKKPCK